MDDRIFDLRTPSFPPVWVLICRAHLVKRIPVTVPDAEFTSYGTRVDTSLHHPVVYTKLYRVADPSGPGSRGTPSPLRRRCPVVVSGRAK